jgi:hypothetical protein
MQENMILRYKQKGKPFGGPLRFRKEVAPMMDCVTVACFTRL